MRKYLIGLCVLSALYSTSALAKNCEPMISYEDHGYFWEHSDFNIKETRSHKAYGELICYYERCHPGTVYRCDSKKHRLSYNALINLTAGGKPVPKWMLDDTDRASCEEEWGRHHGVIINLPSDCPATIV